MPSSLSARLFALARHWGGPLLVLVGLLSIAAIALPSGPGRSTLAWWILKSALAPERVVPLVGLGIGLAVVGTRSRIASLLLFALGIAAGFHAREALLSMLAALPGAVDHLFLTGPISAIAAGLAMIAPARLRGWLLPLGAGIVGAMLALAIKLTDPSLHDPAIPRAGVVVAAWIVAGVFLTARAFAQPWFGIAGRIAGSWLLAIGLLYGGASIAYKPAPLQALTPAPPPAYAPPFPDLSQSDGGLDLGARPNDPGALPPPGASDGRSPL